MLPKTFRRAIAVSWLNSPCGDCLLRNVFRWFYFTWKALAAVKKRRFVEHKNYMVRSYALTCAAVTLRTWKLVLAPIVTIDLAELYVIDAWLGFVPNLLIAELIIRWNRPHKK